MRTNKNRLPAAVQLLTNYLDNRSENTRVDLGEVQTVPWSPPLGKSITSLDKLLKILLKFRSVYQSHNH